METMDREALKRLSLKDFKDSLRMYIRTVSFYRKLYQEKDFDPREIRTMVDFRRHVPVFTKDMIRQFRDQTGDPLGGMLCVTMDQVRWAGSVQGPAGRPPTRHVGSGSFHPRGMGGQDPVAGGVRPGGKAHIAAPPYAKGSQTFQHGAEKLAVSIWRRPVSIGGSPDRHDPESVCADTYFVMTTAL